MKEQDIAAIIRDNKFKTKEFVLTYTNGTTEKKRMFVTSYGEVCEFKKGSRKYGFHFNGAGMVDKFEPAEKKSSSPYTMFIRNTTNVATMLSRSGLWPDMCKQMKGYSEMTEPQFNEAVKLYDACDNVFGKYHGDEYFAKSDETRKAFDDYFSDLGIEADYYHFMQLTAQRQVVSIPYTDGSSKEHATEQVLQIIEKAKSGKHEETIPSFYWYGKYDYHVSVEKGKDGFTRGWFSAEYHRCGNGHYYLLLDATHALFYEDD